MTSLEAKAKVETLSKELEVIKKKNQVEVIKLKNTTQKKKMCWRDSKTECNDRGQNQQPLGEVTRIYPTPKLRKQIGK